jgi:serine/threonine-protein kinase
MTMLGTLLGGRYRLDAQIGRGGMSTVYLAFDMVLERPVAIKLMHREIASDSAQLERFRREARSVARLSHPHIVTVIDAGEEPSPEAGEEVGAGGVGTPFIVLEYVEGETLKALIRREGPLEITRAVAYAIELARALGAAHERLIVHRDVKPQNVLIGVEGSAKITDFGIARTLSEVGLTMDGRVLGTTDYVSPEQAVGQSVTGQSDLYSLGIVLYEMLTGTVPFSGETPVAVAMKHVREDVPDVQLARGEVSAATASVVDRATAKDLAQRYPDAASMLADLEEVLAIEASRAGQATGEVTTVLRTLPGTARRRLPWRMRHPVRFLTSLALLATLVALAIVLAANGTHRGIAPDVDARPGLTAVPLAQTAAHDYNPFGTGPENRDQVDNLVDSDPNTTWLEHRGLLRRHAQEGRRHRRGDVCRRSPERGREADRNPNAHPRLRRADLRRQPHRPVPALRKLDPAHRARLAGSGRRRHRRPRQRPHPAQPQRSTLSLLPRVDHQAARRHGVRLARRAHAVPLNGGPQNR